MPVGRGRTWASGGVVGKVLEGWQVSGIATFSDGVPFDVFGNVDSSHTGLSDRADLVGSSSIPDSAGRT